MNEEKILGFLNDVIIENGIRNNLDNRTIKKNIADYRTYLGQNGLADKDVLKTIATIEEKIEEYVDLVKDFKQAGIPIPTGKVKPNCRSKSKPVLNSGISSCGSIISGNSCAKERLRTSYQTSSSCARGVSRSC